MTQPLSSDHHDSSASQAAFRTAVHEVTVVFSDESRQSATYASRDAALARAERIAAGELPRSVAAAGKPISRIEVQSREAIYPAAQRRGVSLA